ncbi:MAG: hypothetical protein ACI4T5_02045, partial [Prevotella sp.]
MRQIILVLLSAVCLHCLADNEQLYRSLDEAIAQAPEFVKKREQRIDNLRRRLLNAKDDKERYQLTCLLFQEYKPYKSDSAAKYISEAILLAEKGGDKSQQCL